jgi:hypothetical protein
MLDISLSGAAFGFSHGLGGKATFGATIGLPGLGDSPMFNPLNT